MYATVDSGLGNDEEDHLCFSLLSLFPLIVKNLNTDSDIENLKFE